MARRPKIQAIFSSILLNLAPRGGKTLPREAPEGPKPSQDRPQRHQEAAKIEKSRWCKLRLQKKLSWANDGHPLGHHFGPPRVPKRGPRAPQERPKSSQEASRNGVQNWSIFLLMFWWVFIDFLYQKSRPRTTKNGHRSGNSKKSQHQQNTVKTNIKLIFS